MIVGIGTDIIEIERIRAALAKQGFMNKYFTQKEIALYHNRKENPEVLAGNFAVKEAVSKVFGTGIKGFGLTDIEVLRDDRGMPFVTLYGKAKALSDALGINRIMVSISHNKCSVIGFAIGEGDDRIIR